MSKKRKLDFIIKDIIDIPVNKDVTHIIRMDFITKKWLVEWSDCTRTWLTYEQVKNLHIFREYVENLIYKKRKTVISPPSYIC